MYTTEPFYYLSTDTIAIVTQANKIYAIITPRKGQINDFHCGSSCRKT